MDSELIESLFQKLKLENEKCQEIVEQVESERNKTSTINLLKNVDTLKFLISIKLKIFNTYKLLLENIDFEYHCRNNDPKNYYVLIEINFNEKFFQNILVLNSKLNIRIKNKFCVKNESVSLSNPLNIIIPYPSTPVNSVLDVNLYTKFDDLFFIVPVYSKILNVSYCFQLVNRPITTNEDYNLSEKLVKICNSSDNSLESVSEEQTEEIQFSDGIKIQDIYNIMLKNCAHQSDITILNKYVSNDLKSRQNEYLRVGKHTQVKCIIDMHKKTLIITGDQEKYMKDIVDYFNQEFGLFRKN